MDKSDRAKLLQLMDERPAPGSVCRSVVVRQQGNPLGDIAHLLPQGLA
jgi:hypothetical protein